MTNAASQTSTTNPTNPTEFALVQKSDGISRHGIVRADSPAAALAEYARQLRACDYHDFSEAEIAETLHSVTAQPLSA